MLQFASKTIRGKLCSALGVEGLSTAFFFLHLMILKMACRIANVKGATASPTARGMGLFTSTKLHASVHQ